MTKRLLVDYIKQHAQVTDRELDQVEVLENFSFVTAPSDAARHILRSFDHLQHEGKPIVTKARPDNPNGKHLAGKRRKERPAYDRYESFTSQDRWDRGDESYSRKKSKGRSSSKQRRRR